MNHSWHVTLYVTSRGLTTSPIPFPERDVEIELDFIDHRLRFRTGDGAERSFPLQPRTVADFYHDVMRNLSELGIEVTIHRKPNEIEDATPFDEDRAHRAYDPDAAHRFWQALVQTDRVFKEFRSRYLGKVSPVHFFWGSFDLAVTRFSGRRAPVHPGGVPNLPDWITREAYSHEVSSCGFWPGNEKFPQRGVLLLRLSRARWIRKARREAGEGVLQRRLARVLPATTTSFASLPSPTRPSSISSRRPTRRRRIAAVGIAKRSR